MRGGAGAPWLVDLRDKERVFFLPGIRYPQKALSSVRGEGFCLRGLAILLLVSGLTRPGFTIGEESTTRIDKTLYPVVSDSIRFWLPPSVIEERRWIEGETESDLLMTVIIPDRLNSETAMDLGGLLSHQAGVVLRRTGGPGSSSFVSIRGATAQQVLILLNGKRLNTAQGGSVDLSALSPEAVSRIEVYREANSARWDSESIGGVLNIVTTRADEERFRLRTLGGSYGMRSLSLGGSIGNETGIRFGTDYRTSDESFPFADPRREGERRRINGDYRVGTFSTTLERAVGDGGRFTLYGSASSDDRGAPGPIEFPTPEARLSDRRLFFQGEIADTAGSTDLALSTSFHRLDRRYRNPDPVLWADDHHLNSCMSVSLEGERAMVDRGDLEFGMSHERDFLSSTTDGLQDRGKTSGYVRMGLYLTGREENRGLESSISPGLRLESVEGYDAQLFPFLSSRLSFFEDQMVLRGSFGKKYRVPSFDELFWPLSSGAQGNPDLRPERSTGWEFSGTLYLLSGRVRLQNVYYRRDLVDLIEWTPGARGIWRPHNVGLARDEGIEFGGAFAGEPAPFLPPVSLEITHSIIRATNEGDDPLTHGMRLVRRPGSISSGRLEMTPLEQLTFGVSWSRVGRRYLTNTNTKWIEGYHVLDLHMAFRLWGGARSYFSINNLGDKNYYDMDEYPVPGRILTIAFEFEVS